MLEKLLSSDHVKKVYDVSFSFRFSEKYWKEFSNRVTLDFPIFKLRLPIPPVFSRHRNNGISVVYRTFNFLLYLVFGLPLIAYQFVELYVVLSRVKPDLVHINNAGYPGALSARTAALASRLAGVGKVLMVVNNLAVDYDRPTRWLDYWFDYFVVRSVDQFVTGSTAAADRLSCVLRLPPGKLRSIHNGIITTPGIELAMSTKNRLGISNFEGTLFGTVAIFKLNKGHSVLLDALLILRDKNHDISKEIKILLEGDGPLDGELREFVAKNHLDDICKFIGVESNVMNFIESIDIFVLPSIGSEDLPNVISEAMSFSKPVIATRLAGIPEQVINGVTGLLVDPGDAAELASAIEALSSDERLRTDMGDAGYDYYCSNFTYDIAEKGYLNLYRELLEPT